MIRIVRPPAPSFFQSSELLSARDALENSFQSNSQERLKFSVTILSPVRKELTAIFRGKCAYCETPLEVASAAHIDTFRPKSGARDLAKEFSAAHYYWLAYDWDNLMATCSNCNKHKGNLFPLEPGSPRAPIGATGELLDQEKYLLIDPCREEPEEHLRFEAEGQVTALTEKGRVSIEVLGLNRESLVRERKRTADQLLVRLRLNDQLPDTELLEVIAEIQNGNSDHPYLAVQRALLRDWRGKKAVSEVMSWNVSHALPQTKALLESLKISRQLREFKRFSIRCVEISNFRTIDSLTLDILPNSDSDRESWLLLLGDNGVGKSSILQAIALALAGREQLEKLRLRPRDILRSGQIAGHVLVHSYENDQPLELRFNAREFTSASPEPVSFLLGYGATRLLPKGRLRSNPYRQDYVNVGNLFDYTAMLTNVSRWLAGVAQADFDRIATALFDLLDLEAGDRISRKGGKLYIFHDGHTTSLEQASDGYKSIVTLACDIMKTLSLDEASYHHTQGIVLVDELGNHLHPRWRMKIVQALRNTFPLLQFIVSTHELLCLRGLLHGEVTVLLKDEKNEVRALDRKLLPDHNTLRVDQLLTSDLFGLINTLDAETEKKFEDYYRLLAKPQPERSAGEDAQVEQLTRELADKELIGPTPQLQALYQVVNETYAKNIRESGFKTKTQLKDATVAQVKGMLDQEGSDWL